MRRYISWLFAVLLAMAPLPALAQTDNSLSRVIESKVLKVGVALNAPWVIKRPDGTLAGYDIDLTNAIAEDLGAKAQFIEVPFADLLATVTAGKVDIAAAGLAITPARARTIAFSASTGTQDILTVASTKALGNDPDSAVQDPKFRIAVLEHSTDEAAARQFYPKATVVAYPSASAALSALVAGDAQAMVATAPVPVMAATLYDAELQTFGRSLMRTAEAFALRPEQGRLLQYVNNWIVARQTDGYIDNIGNYWFANQKWIRDLEPAREGARK